MEDERVSNSSDFARLLRYHRLAAGLSQEALAERARMSADGISALERGQRRTPRRETLALLADALALDDEQRVEFREAAARAALARRTATASFEPWPSAGVFDLPLALTSFVGRDAELHEIATLMREHRLVTLTGAGGVGKTQTALQVGCVIRDTEEIAVCFVGLAPISDPSQVPVATAFALGLQDAPSRPPLEALLAYLKGRTQLLILDNCEHVIAEAARLVEVLLVSCPRLRILATTREPLRTAGERAYRLASLSPDGAVELFTDRATAADYHFALTEENGPIVIELCRCLDGIPLAIELAAARVQVLGLRHLAKMIEGRLGLLRGGERKSPHRQQTMQATIDWSYQLLTGGERLLFERISIFAGGCTLEMAALVCGDEGQDRTDVLDILSSLIDKSLVTAGFAGDETRYQLLETTRQYARERLVERGEYEAIAHRHALALFQLSRVLTGNERPFCRNLGLPPNAIRKMRAERLNFDEAMNWTLARRGDVRLGQELAWRVPFLRVTDTLRWLKLALEHGAEETPSAVTVNLKIQLGAAFSELRDMKTAIATARSALAASQNLGDKRLTAKARRQLGRLLAHTWSLDDAESELREALNQWREVGDRRGIAAALWSLGLVALRRGSILEARSLYAEALETLGDGDEYLARLIESEYALAEHSLGNHESALTRLRSVTSIQEAEAADGGMPVDMTDMLREATFLIALERFEEARDAALHALAVTLDPQNPLPNYQAYAAHRLATVSVLHPGQVTDSERRERFEACAKLIGWNDAVAAAHGESTPWSVAPTELSVLRGELGMDRVAALLREGATLEHDQALDLLRLL